jgi:predicted dehydrogenase
MTEHEPVRVAVVGVAGIGMAHLFAAAGLEDEYRLTAVCDVDAEAAKSNAESFSVAAYTSFGDLLGAGVADAVVLAVPPSLHAEMAIQALDAGLHVYCEKPLGRTIAECDDVADAAERSDRVVQVGCQHRFQRSYVAAHDLLRSGELGAPFRASVVATNWFRAQRYFDARPWRARWETVGGGVLLSQAIHQIDAFLWLLGQPDRVSAEAWRSLHDAEVEDEATAILRLPGGARGTLIASTVDPVGTDRIEIHTDGGSLVLDGFGLRVARFDGTASSLSAECAAEFPELTVAWEDAVVPDPDRNKEWFGLVRATHRDFVSAIRDGRSPRNTPAEASKAVELANAIILSALDGSPVDLPLDRDSYTRAFERLCAGELELPRVAAVR